jgi:uncharacterized delta-60 repeat protein
MKRFLFTRLFDVAPLVALIFLCCNCSPSPVDPNVETPTSASITVTTATLGGDVLSHGSTNIHSRGVVYSRKSDNPVPKLGNENGVTTIPAATADLGVFTVDVTGLEPGTEYVFSAYAESLDGDDYTDPVSFTTLGGTDPNGDVTGIDGSDINAIATQADGKILIGGVFNAVQGEERINLARLNADGSLDPTFAPYVEYSPYQASVRAIAVQDDGKIVIGGIFYEIDGHFAGPSIARLNPDGSRDETFNASTDYGVVEGLAIQPDGKILVSGSFGSFGSGGLNGDVRYQHLGRLNPDGTLDTTFIPAPGTGPNNSVSSIAVQDDGKILISGFFNLYSGVAQERFARLNSNGTLDTGFAPDFDAYTMALQADGKILIASYNPAQVPFPNDPTFGLYRVETTGTLDPAYATSTGNTGGAFVNNPIYSIAVQSDGKAIIAGNFTEVDGTPRDRLARINADGTLDPTFNVELEEIAYAITLSDDGKLLVGATTFGAAEPDAELFVQIEASSALSPAVSNLSTTATSVEWFRSGSVPVLSDVVFERSLDGGITWSLVGDGVASRSPSGWEKIGVNMTTPGLVRARGRTDTGGSNGSEGVIEKVEDYPVPGVSHLTLANPTATDIDSDYALLGGEITATGTSPITERGVVYSRTVDHDTPIVGAAGVVKEVEGGTSGGVFTVDVFDLVGGTSYSYRAYAINALGAVFYSDVDSFVTVGAPSVISPTSDLITDTGATLGGNVFSDGGNAITERGVYVMADTELFEDRLGDNATGYQEVVAPTNGTGVFTVPVTGLTPGTSYFFAAYAINSEGTVYSEEGYFTTTDNSEPEPGENEPSSLSSVEASAPAGQIDSSFDVGDGLGDLDGIVQAIAVLPGGLGDLLVAGEFTQVGGEIHKGIARLDDSGSVYSEFDTRTDGIVNSVAVGIDGSIVIGGIFTTVNGITRNGIAKIDEDGANVSPTEFNPGTGADNVVYSVAVQEDGKILVGGLFANVQGQVRSRIARLNANGTLDTGFDPGANDAVYSIAVQPDGKILVAGNFTNIAGTSVNRIARLNDNGTIDANFNPGSGANGRVAALALQPDGKILLGGYFTQVDGANHSRVARLAADGSLDPAFVTGDGANNNVLTMALQTDGKILIGGIFTSFNGTSITRIARLNANGGLDTTFDPGVGADGEVSALALQTDGSILIGGNFLNFDGAAAPYLLRFGNDVGVEDLTVIDGTQLRWTRSGGGPAIHPLGFGLSTNLGRTWTDLGEGVPIAGGRSITGQNLPLVGLVRVLGQTSGGFLGGSTGLVEEIAAYDHRPIVAGLQAKLAAANGNVAKIQKQIKAAKKKKDKAKLKKLNKSLKTATAQVASAKADLAKY